ncbi:MAG: SH3 domain-containing protein [Chloroflexi bacterium]|nr:SH3 domain-containing protein [Chloroflexota bacterium]MCY3581352.1 SH3 domain-containing protein [Chloroflexota bacterium]MXV92146.1 SH3 domain-containing protein [Chloroflexota bacterium]MXX51389.1 SH3 domain-containing protein [Chloroflexota bacterium]MYC56812.1 SH3 domain-containing protein [Chloroflexota bacterium]
MALDWRSAARFGWLMLLVLALAGCSAPSQSPIPTAVERLIVVTPTVQMTRVPTVVRATPTSHPPSATPAERILDDASCQAALLTHYTAASDQCLAADDGTICSGGTDAGFASGAPIPADTVKLLRSPPFSLDAGIGLLWLRMAQSLLADALLIGEVELRDLSSDSSWRALTIESGSTRENCAGLPPFGALVLQSRYGQTARLEINNVALAIDGTVVVMTQAQSSYFIVIEGSATLRVGARSLRLLVGTQASLAYEAGDWTTPADLPAEASLLDYANLAELPIELFPRPLPIPQPGYAQTKGRVNMRAAPDINGRLLYQVPAGETMTVLGISIDSEWLHIRLGNGEMGWMSAGLLAKNLDKNLPVYAEAPPPLQRLGVHANRAIVNVPAGGNLRAAPDTAFQVLRTLPIGTETKLLARSPYSPWVKVQASDAIGWMALFTLTTQSVIGSLPIDYQVPLPTRATPTPSFSFGGGHAYPDPSGGY